jgi:hypothetical protein
MVILNCAPVNLLILYDNWLPNKNSFFDIIA